jgi:hypothetical protein
MMINFADTFVVLVIVIEREFIVHPHSDEHRYAHSNRQASDVDKCIAFIPGNTPEYDLQIIFYHDQLGLSISLTRYMLWGEMPI